MEAVHPAAFIDFFRFNYLRAERKIVGRASRRQLRSTAKIGAKKSEEELAKVGTLEAQVVNSQNRIGEIRREVEALEVVLAAKKRELEAEETNLAQIGEVIKAQEIALAEAASAAEAAWREVPAEIGTDDEDLHVLAQMDEIRSRAIGAINAFL